MKKKNLTMLVGFLSLMVLLGNPGNGMATILSFEDTKNIELNIGNNSSNPWTYSWDQIINFNPAADSIVDAFVAITHRNNAESEIWFLSNSNDVFIGELTESDGSAQTDTFDVTSLFSSFSGTTFTLALKLSETTDGNDKLNLDTSKIFGRYNSIENPPLSNNPAPEPATMLLLGFGLLGLAGVSRKKN